jgi:hypothetical protein
MKHVFKLIHAWEAKHITRKVRKSAWYFFAKVTLLFPLVVISLIQLGATALYNLAFKGRVKRGNKPDLVFSNIVAGFTGLAFPDEKTEVLAKRRAEICASCPFAVESGLYSVIADNRTKNIQGMKCDKCGCNLSAKVRSVGDYCPVGKW